MTDDRLRLWRLRVQYQKGGRLAYLGHLEVINTINRCIRRSGLPFSVGNGFARRMRLQFSQALPVGASSTCEFYDLMLTREVDPAEALSALAAATPSQLAPVRAGYKPRKVPALEAWANRSRWRVEVLGSGLEAGELDAALGAVRERGSLTYLRGEKEKHVELGVTLVGWDVRPGRGGSLEMALDTRSTNDGSLRPATLLQAALGERDYSLRVCRLGQWHEEPDGSLTSPLP